ncbi:hypothetical protein [uncultured Erythrobacter sp.]|uniref:tetratricopeptide repeat protein n=1 Tax=uncultured Erythrobacter sp. TaxID=263913 RepID=UPI0026239743|nr:hypothetical protein [uncultured Erythrobacter sp.]
MRGLTLRKRASGMALAIALATGAVVTTGAFVAEPAHAQKKKKKEQEAKAQYSEEFVAAYQPLNTTVNDEAADLAPIKPQLVALIPLSISPDEKNAAGGLIFNAGAKLNDQALQLQGMELMLAGGKVPLENVGRFNFIAYQLANGQGDFAKARGYLQEAINRNFTSESVNGPAMQVALAESYFSENRFKEGLGVLKAAIESQKNAGQRVDEAWYRRGLTVAYNNKVVPEVYDMTLGWIADYPSDANWRDAINLTRNLNEFEGQELLDLFRLGRKVGALQDQSDYDYYVESADPRRLPKEVKDVIEEGLAAGVVSQDNLYLSEALQTANGRIQSDRAELPALDRDASAAGAGLRTVVAAGDAFLSYGDYAKAAQFFEKALGLAGVEKERVMTRLGIAQVALGDHNAAKATFAQIGGQRGPIARLWTTFSEMQQGSASSASTASASTTGN